MPVREIAPCDAPETTSGYYCDWAQHPCQGSNVQIIEKVTVAGNYVYVADWLGGLMILRFTGSSMPAELVAGIQCLSISTSTNLNRVLNDDYIQAARPRLVSVKTASTGKV
jgi:hypothetical protein